MADISFIEVHHIKAMFTIRKLKYTQKTDWIPVFFKLAQNDT